MNTGRSDGAVSIRLGLNVGSYEETETERGVAHFIEHMAFRSTRQFPSNSVDGAFASKGVAFGRDHNAETGLFSTQYEIDLPPSAATETARAFTWLRDGYCQPNGNLSPLAAEKVVVG